MTACPEPALPAKRDAPVDARMAISMGVMRRVSVYRTRPVVAWRRHIAITIDGDGGRIAWRRRGASIRQCAAQPRAACFLGEHRGCQRAEDY